MIQMSVSFILNSYQIKNTKGNTIIQIASNNVSMSFGLSRLSQMSQNILRSSILACKILEITLWDIKVNTLRLTQLSFMDQHKASLTYGLLLLSL